MGQDSPYDAIATRYSTLFQDFDSMRCMWRQKISDVFCAHDVRYLDTIIDLCCGTGLLTGALLELGYRVVAIDASLAMLEEAKRQYPPERYPVTYLHGDVATRVMALEGKEYAGFVCGGSSVLHLEISAIEQLAKGLFEHTQADGQGIISVFDWSYCSCSPSWTPRAFHESSDGRIRLIIEMFDRESTGINTTTIIELDGRIGEEWRMRNTDFTYFGHSPHLILSICESAGFKSIDTAPFGPHGEMLVHVQR